MQSNEFVFTPSNPVSEAFIWNTSRVACFDGGVGNSKTTSGFIRLLLLASQFPGSRWVVFRQTYLDLCQTTRRTFDKVCPAGWVVRNVREQTQLANNAEIHWMHLDTADEKTLMGLEVNGAFGDQIEEIHPELIEILDSRLGRWQLTQWEERCPPYFWATSNPRGHDAVYYSFSPEVVKYDNIQYFPEWDKTQTDEALRLGMNIEPKFMSPSIAATGQFKSYFFGSTIINLPTLQKVEPSYVANLLRKPESWKKIWVYGSRDFFEGSIHPNFKKDIHIYDPEKFKPGNVRLVLSGFDYGLSSPTAYLTAVVDREGFVFIEDEYYEANKTIKAHAAEIRNYWAKLTPEAIFADPTVFHEDTRDRKVVTKSIAQEYAEEGIGFVRADNNEDTSIEKIEELLAVNPDRMNPVTKKLGSPRLFISSKCVHTIEEIQQQRRKMERNALTGEREFIDERDDTVPDHAYDCLRYICNSKYLDYKPWQGTIRTPSFGSKQQGEQKPHGTVTVGAR